MNLHYTIENEREAEAAANALARWGRQRADQDFPHLDVLEDTMSGAILAQVEDPDYEMAEEVAAERESDDERYVKDIRKLGALDITTALTSHTWLPSELDHIRHMLEETEK